MDFSSVIRSGDLAKVQQLLEEGHDINHSDSRGFTPLILASYFNQDAIVQALLAQGAEIDKVDSAGHTALLGAAFKGYKDVMSILLSYKACLLYTSPSPRD